MSSQIIVIWDNADKTVLMVIIEDGWDWADMRRAIGEINRLLDTVPHPVYTIMDFTKSSKIPDNALVNLKQLNRSHHPNQDKTAVVGLGIYGQVLINMFIQIYGMMSKGNDVKLVNDIAAAYAFFDMELNPTDEI